MRIGVRDKRFARDAWLRCCQECGNVQAMKSPEGQKTDNWREAKCRKCKSEGSLDYGTPNEYSVDEEDDEPQETALEAAARLKAVIDEIHSRNK